MLEQFFECEENAEIFIDYKFRQKWAQTMLFKGKFVWAVSEDVSVSDISLSLLTLPQGQQSGLMRAPFILQVFAVHLNSIVGAVDVPSLEVTNDYGDGTVLAKYPPKGALALAVAAVGFFHSTQQVSHIVSGREDPHPLGQWRHAAPRCRSRKTEEAVQQGHHQGHKQAQPSNWDRLKNRVKFLRRELGRGNEPLPEVHREDEGGVT